MLLSAMKLLNLKVTCNEERKDVVTFRKTDRSVNVISLHFKQIKALPLLVSNVTPLHIIRYGLPLCNISDNSNMFNIFISVSVALSQRSKTDI